MILARIHTLVVMLASVSAAMFSGCGSTDESFADVEGEVTLAGQPAVAEIVFEPILSGASSGGRASTATSDVAGKFRLMLDDSQPGARIGRHRVTIRVLSISQNNASESSTGLSGKPVGAMKVSQFTREVKPNGNQFHFLLTL